ncbi:MAG: sigma 54-interacting transcriptional regulator [Clostridium sp.]
MSKGLKNIKIKVIATYKEMEVEFENLHFENVEIDVVFIKDMAEVKEIVAESEKNVDIFLSRGAVKRKIEEISDIPVVRIPTTNFDLIKAISEGRKSKKDKVGFLSYIEDNYSIKEIEEILNIKIVDFKYANIEEQEEKIEAMVKLGVDIVIGGGLTPVKAEKIGVDSILLKSGDESIMTSIKSAIKIVDIRRKEREKRARLNAILDSINQGLIVTDEDGKISLYNPTAEKIIKKPRRDVLKKNIEDIIYNTIEVENSDFEMDEVTKLQNINNEIIAISTTPIILDGNEIGRINSFEKSSKIQKIEKKIRENLHKKGLIAKYNFGDIKTENKEMIKIKEISKIYSKTDETILINGESGTGKELFAQSIHNESDRKRNPFVAVNCASISENLLESELFGYEGGAFTGARKDGKIGLFELAHRGTIFLDEIGEISKHLQSSILRVIQEKEIRRVGGDNVIPIDIRIICATNRNLEEEVLNGNFREDLYYRLNVLYINILPLRKRKEDMFLIVKNLLKGYEKKNIREEDVFNILNKLPKNYEWKGNIREFESFVRRAYLINKLPIEYKHDMEEKIKEKNELIELKVDISRGLKETTRDMEKKIIKYLIDNNYSMEEILTILKISRASFMRKKQSLKNNM